MNLQLAMDKLNPHLGLGRKMETVYSFSVLLSCGTPRGFGPYMPRGVSSFMDDLPPKI